MRFEGISRTRRILALVAACLVLVLGMAAVGTNLIRPHLVDSPGGSPSVDAFGLALALPSLYVIVMGIAAIALGFEPARALGSIQGRARFLTILAIGWWVWGLAVCAAFFSVATEGLALAALGVLVYGLLGGGITWLGVHSLIQSSLLDPLRIAMRPKRIRIGDTVTVRIAQGIKKDLFLEAISIGIRCFEYRNRDLRIEYEDEVQVLANHEARQGETLELSGELTIPDRPRLRSRQQLDGSRLEEVLWDVFVRIEIAGRREIQVGEPIEVLGRGPGRRRTRRQRSTSGRSSLPAS